MKELATTLDVRSQILGHIQRWADAVGSKDAMQQDGDCGDDDEVFEDFQFPEQPSAVE